MLLFLTLFITILIYYVRTEIKFRGSVMLLVDKNLHSECSETLHVNDVLESIVGANLKLVVKSLYLELHNDRRNVQMNM